MSADSATRYVATCSECAARVKVRASHLGKRCRCPACKSVITITSLASTDVNDASQPATNASMESVSVNDSGLASQRSDAATESSAETPMVRRVGRFDLQKKLGQGAFGEVWLARDTGLDRMVAIKLPKFRSDDVKRVRRFIIEAKTAASLRHPNIVPTFDAGQIDGQHYIATEFVDGLPLSEINNRGKAPLRWAVMIVCKLAEAVHYAHEQSIVHRDIKPDNVLIDKQGEPQLLDFGLAKRMDDSAAQTIDGTVMGTPGYMSPEQARGATSEIGPASDQYSLGVTLYRLLAGRTPFTGTPAAVLQQILTVPPPPLSEFVDNLHPDLEAICEKARNADPRDRYATCQLFADDLQNYLAGESVIARPISRLTKGLRWSGKHPREATLAALCFGIGFLTLALSSIGWAAAVKNELAAVESQQLVEAETNRILSLEASLETRVAEAEAIRDTAQAAQLAEAESRKNLESENERLAAANAAAEAALKRSQEAAAKFATQESSNADLTSSFNDLKTKLAESGNRDVQSIGNNPAGKSNSELDFNKTKLTKTDRTDLICEWNGEPTLFKLGGVKVDRFISSVGNLKSAADLTLDANGSVVYGLTASAHSTSNHVGGIAMMSAQGSHRSLVTLSASSQASKASLLNGVVDHFSGYHAIDRDQNIYFIAERSCLVKYSTNDDAFSIVADYLMDDVDVYNRFDPEGLYVIRSTDILRYDRGKLDDPTPKVVFKRDHLIGPNVEYLSKDVLFAHSLIFDYSQKKYFTCRNKMLNIICAVGNGRYIARASRTDIAIIELIDAH